MHESEDYMIGLIEANKKVIETHSNQIVELS
jgi:hypothetical protein